MRLCNWQGFFVVLFLSLPATPSQMRLRSFFRSRESLRPCVRRGTCQALHLFVFRLDPNNRHHAKVFVREDVAVINEVSNVHPPEVHE